MSEAQLEGDLSDKASSRSSPHFLIDITSGVALGVLVGVLVGISASQVVASTVAAILALVATFFGFGGSVGTSTPQVNTARIVGFGFAMALALVGGIALRAHGFLGPSFSERVASFSVQGLDPQLARDLAIYEHTGLRTGLLIEATERRDASPLSPFAFGDEQGTADSNCANLHASILPDPDARLNAMILSDEPWASFGRIGQSLSGEHKSHFLEAVYNDRCNFAGIEDR